MNFTLRLSLVICLISCSYSWGSIVDSKKIALDKKISQIKAVAENGNVEAQLLLASLYLEGYEDIQKDYQQGIEWFEMAAKSGNPEIQMNLGEIYHFAYYGDKQLDKAFHWYKKSAENNFSEAMDYVGIFYSGGIGGAEKSCAKAIYWYEKAYKTGYKASKGNLVWKLATCEDEKYRDGQKALKLALEIIQEQGEENSNNLDNLAAAHAELEQFELASKAQLKAIELLDPNEKSGRVDKFKQRLNLYQNKKKWSGFSIDYSEDYTD